MIIFAVLLTLFGLLMLIRPKVVWTITEPSNLYIMSTRFGGVMCTLAGLGGILVYSL